MYDGRLTLVTAPAFEPLTQAEAWAHLRVPLLGSPAAPADETNIDRLIQQVREHVDGRDGWLGRALVTQTWDLKMDGFPRAAIKLPLPPLQSVTSVTYVDGNGDSQTLAASGYTVTGVGELGPARIVPSYGNSWPTTRNHVDVVTVRFVCGYASGSSPDDNTKVPAAIRGGLLQLLEHWYDNPSAVSVGGSVAPMPMAVESLLMPYRVEM